jgi:hypothetical protein
LREFGLRARRPYIGFPLTHARRACGMVWLAAHGPRQFPMRQWRQVFFTDEWRFTLFLLAGRRRGKRFAELAFLRGISLGVARLWSGEGYLTG